MSKSCVTLNLLRHAKVAVLCNNKQMGTKLELDIRSKCRKCNCFSNFTAKQREEFKYLIVDYHFWTVTRECANREGCIVWPIPLVEELLKSNNPSSVQWNNQWIDSIDLGCSTYCVLGRDNETVTKIQDQISRKNGIVSETKDAAKIILLDDEFSDDYDEYWGFVEQYLKNKVEVNYVEKYDGLTEIPFETLSDAFMPLRGLKFKSGIVVADEIKRLGGTSVKQLTVCSILVLDEETSKDDIDVALRNKNPIFSHDWVYRVSANSKRQYPSRNIPPEVSMKGCKVLIENGAKEELEQLQPKDTPESEIENLGGSIFDSNSSETCHRRYTTIAVNHIVDVEKDRNVLCLHDLSNGKHGPFCNTSHFPVYFETSFRLPKLIILTTDIIAVWLAKAMEAANITENGFIFDKEKITQSQGSNIPLFWDGKSHINAVRKLYENDKSHRRTRSVYSIIKIENAVRHGKQVIFRNCIFENWEEVVIQLTKPSRGKSSEQKKTLKRKPSDQLIPIKTKIHHVNMTPTAKGSGLDGNKNIDQLHQDPVQSEELINEESRSEQNRISEKQNDRSITVEPMRVTQIQGKTTKNSDIDFSKYSGMCNASKCYALIIKEITSARDTSTVPTSVNEGWKEKEMKKQVIGLFIWANLRKSLDVVVEFRQTTADSLTSGIRNANFMSYCKSSPEMSTIMVAILPNIIPGGSGIQRLPTDLHKLMFYKVSNLLSQIKLSHVIISKESSFEILCRSNKEYYRTIATYRRIEDHGLCYDRFELNRNLIDVVMDQDKQCSILYRQRVVVLNNDFFEDLHTSIKEMNYLKVENDDIAHHYKPLIIIRPERGGSARVINTSSKREESYPLLTLETVESIIDSHDMLVESTLHEMMVFCDAHSPNLNRESYPGVQKIATEFDHQRIPCSHCSELATTFLGIVIE